MIWDGLEFFSFDDSKLARLRGAKTSVFDKFKNKKKLFMMTMLVSIAMYIILKESSKVG